MGPATAVTPRRSLSPDKRNSMTRSTAPLQALRPQLLKPGQFRPSPFPAGPPLDLTRVTPNVSRAPSPTRATRSVMNSPVKRTNATGTTAELHAMQRARSRSFSHLTHKLSSIAKTRKDPFLSAEPTALPHVLSPIASVRIPSNETDIETIVPALQHKKSIFHPRRSLAHPSAEVPRLAPVTPGRPGTGSRIARSTRYSEGRPRLVKPSSGL